MRSNLLGTEVRARLRSFAQLRGPEIDISSIVVCDRLGPMWSFSIYDDTTDYGFKNYGKQYRELVQYMAKYSLRHAQNTVTEKASRLILIIDTEVSGCVGASAKTSYDRTMECGRQAVAQLKRWIETFVDTSSEEELSAVEKMLVRLFLTQFEERTTIIVVEGNVWIDSSMPTATHFTRSVDFS